VPNGLTSCHSINPYNRRENAVSRASQVILGIVFAFAAIFFVWFGMNDGVRMPAGSMPFYFLAAFCGVVASACLVRQGRPLMLRIIGAVICIAFVASAPGMFKSGKVIQALGGLFVFALPCGYLALTGKYPIWGEAGAVFGEKKEPRD